MKINYKMLSVALIICVVFILVNRVSDNSVTEQGSSVEERLDSLEKTVEKLSRNNNPRKHGREVGKNQDSISQPIDKLKIEKDSLNSTNENL